MNMDKACFVANRRKTVDVAGMGCWNLHYSALSLTRGNAKYRTETCKFRARASTHKICCPSHI